MSKRILIGLVILVLLAAGLPPLLGIVYERQTRSQIAEAPQDTYLSLELTRYDRGLYSSQGTLSIALSEAYLAQIQTMMNLPDPAAAQTEEQQAEIEMVLDLFRDGMKVDFDAKHGPLMFRDGVHFGLASVRSDLQPASGPLAEFQQFAKAPYLLRGDALVGFFGTTDFQLSMPTMSGDVEGARFEFAGLQAAGSYMYGSGRLRLNGSGPGMSLKANDGGMSLDGLVFDMDYHKLTEQLWLGKGDISFGSMSFDDPESSVSMTIRDLGLAGDIGLNDAGDRLTMSAVYSIASVEGIPEQRLEAMELGVYIRDIDLEAAKDYARIAQSLPPGTGEGMLAQIGEMQAVGERVLRGSPSMEFNPVRFTWNDEPFLANVQVRFDGDAMPADLQMLQANPALMMAALSGDGQIEASEGIARHLARSILRNQIAASIPEDVEVSEADLDAMVDGQVEGTLEALVQQGMIERINGQLRVKIVYANGELMVNGVPIPL